jgi:hypothetical protein
MNPFPGMNPYLERHWRDVHASLIVYMREALQSQLPDGLVARIEERVYVDYPRESITRLIYPDIRVSELRQPAPASSAGTATAVLEAVDISTRIIVEEEEVPIVELPNSLVTGVMRKQRARAGTVEALGAAGACTVPVCSVRALAV